jgi:16S rRNA processing protein RimM
MLRRPGQTVESCWRSWNKSSSARHPQVSDRLVALGEIVTTHGIAGWLKINPYNPDTKVLLSAHTLVLDRDASRSEHEVESSKPHGRQLLVKFRGTDSIDTAKTYIGSSVCLREEDLLSLKPGEYYHYQVVGLEVFDMQGHRIGVVTRTWSTPGGELYVVQGPEKEHLIPAVKEIIEKVDLAAGNMIIDPPDGLLDL